jgi:hypothetical protein
MKQVTMKISNKFLNFLVEHWRQTGLFMSQPARNKARVALPSNVYQTWSVGNSVDQLRATDLRYKHVKFGVPEEREKSLGAPCELFACSSRRRR